MLTWNHILGISFLIWLLSSLDHMLQRILVTIKYCIRARCPDHLTWLYFVLYFILHFRPSYCGFLFSFRGICHYYFVFPQLIWCWVLPLLFSIVVSFFLKKYRIWFLCCKYFAQFHTCRFFPFDISVFQVTNAALHLMTCIHEAASMETQVCKCLDIQTVKSWWLDPTGSSSLRRSCLIGLRVSYVLCIYILLTSYEKPKTLGTIHSWHIPTYIQFSLIG